MARSTGIWIGAAFLLLYFGAYFALLQPVDLTILDGGSGMRVRIAVYRLNYPVTATIFRPALWLDQQMRPPYWAWEELPYGSSCMIVNSKDE